MDAGDGSIMAVSHFLYEENKWRDITESVEYDAWGNPIVVAAPADPLLEVTIDKDNRYGSGRNMNVKNPNPSL